MTSRNHEALASIHQIREGIQDMRTDVKKRSPALDRTLERTPPISRWDPLHAVIGHDERAPQCGVSFRDNGFRCTRTAMAYVVFHMVGHCQRADCDANGNVSGYVCADHLDALEYTAQCRVTELRPKLLRRLFTRSARCPTCGRTLLNAFDLLQAVVTL